MATTYITLTVFKNFTQVDLVKLVKLMTGKVLSTDNVVNWTNVIEVEGGPDFLEIGLDERNDLSIRIYADCRVCYVNWSGALFKYDNALDVYKMIIDKMR